MERISSSVLHRGSYFKYKDTEREKEEKRKAECMCVYVSKLASSSAHCQTSNRPDAIEGKKLDFRHFLFSVLSSTSYAHTNELKHSARFFALSSRRATKILCTASFFLHDSGHFLLQASQLLLRIISSSCTIRGIFSLLLLRERKRICF